MSTPSTSFLSGELPTPSEASTYVSVALLNLDQIADEPQLALVKLLLPATLEVSHPVSVGVRVRDIDHDLDEIVAVEHPAMTSMPLHLLGFVAGRTESIDDL